MNKKINIYFVITKEKPSQCGVYDYSKKLFSKFNKKKFNLFFIEVKKWNLANLLRVRKKTKSNSVILINYPTVGMGLSISFLILKLVLLNRRIIFNLHEFDIFSPYRKLIFLFLSFNSNFLFSNNHDSEVFLKYFPWSYNKIQLIPIFSNIEHYQKKFKQRKGLIFFGHIRKKNGTIDKFFKVCEHIRKISDMEITILGSFMEDDLAYKNYIKSKIDTLGINYFSNLPEDEISKYLSSHKIALLPVQNGLSEKKGSVLACLDHKLIVFSNTGKQSPILLKNLVIDTGSLDDEEIAKKIITYHKTHNNNKIFKNYMLYKNYFSWENVVNSIEQYFATTFH